MVLSELRKVCSGDLSSESRARSINLFLTLAVYNFDFWFDGSRGVVVLDEVEPCVAIVSVDGEYSIYCRSSSASCSDLERQLRKCLGVDEDLNDFFARAARDPLLKAFALRFRGWRLRSTSLWWALVIGVCQQNASFRQGWLMLRRIIEVYGCRARVESSEIPLPPPPELVAKNPNPLRTARVGYRASVIENVARAIASGELRFEDLTRTDPRKAEARLRELRGVGPYTARLALALGARVYDLPPIDRWVKAIASLAYGVDERSVESVWIARWGKWSALAVLALTIALDAEPLRKAIERVERGLLEPREDLVPSPLNLWRWRPYEK